MRKQDNKSISATAIEVLKSLKQFLRIFERKIECDVTSQFGAMKMFGVYTSNLLWLYLVAVILQTTIEFILWA